jgi:rubrerythrin
VSTSRRSTTHPSTVDGVDLDRLEAGIARPSRRGFLALVGVGAAGVALAACSSESTTSTANTTAPSTTGAPPTTMAPATTMMDGAGGDLEVAAAAAGLEVLAVNTYKAALDAATAGKLGSVPPAVAEYVTTAESHHQAALDAWNEVLTGAGEQAVDAPPADLEKTVNDAFGKVTDITGAAELALMLEQTAAATYQKAIPSLESKEAIELAGSIQVVDAQHVAILLFVLGQYPVPDTFASTEMAVA